LLDADIDQAGDGAGRVVGVERAENEVAGERGVDGDGGRFQIANFTDHDDVGRLAQHGAQRGGKGHAHVFVDRDLVDAVELVFDRILHRDDLAVGLVDELRQA
jgi:hypothetical protein